MDVSAFLNTFEGDNASGIELRNEPGFDAIQRAMEPADRRARTQEDGTLSLNAAVDWTTVLSDAEALAATGRDLRLLVIVTRALANAHGFAGLAAGFDMISTSLTDHWDSIHPELRNSTDPAEAALRRRNALQQFENDDNGLLGDLEMNVLLNPRGIGPVRGEELAVSGLSEYDYMAEGPSGLGDDEEAKRKEAFAALKGRVTSATRALVAEERDVADQLLADITSASAAREKLEATFSEKAGMANGMGFRLPELGQFLDRLAATLSGAIAEAGDTEPQGEAPSEVATADTAPAPASAPTASLQPVASVGGAMPSRINSREEAEKCLALVIEFYERTEPASPIPLLAKRVKKLVPMGFLEIMDEIAPSGLKEFRSNAGISEKSK